MDKLRALIERLRALKQAGSRQFELWRQLQEAKNKIETLTSELRYSDRERVQWQQAAEELLGALRRADEKPARVADRLLELAAGYIDPPPEQKPINLYEIRAWQSDYRDYRRVRYQHPQAPGEFEQNRQFGGGAWTRK